MKQFADVFLYRRKLADATTGQNQGEGRRRSNRERRQVDLTAKIKLATDIVETNAGAKPGYHWQVVSPRKPKRKSDAQTDQTT